ncbi:hypothetical protein FIBSPDRAFT_913941 [Athelia psychrophila]|uniref:CxC2-like cysteine cluster KDZ transposase-associated domain-containing protein n=1 Tax=Athelia psychrophila TaxID=1759441 RepID=A0A165YWK6_9AGAM|nr:hypothetical protein FIBSPDRAFT_913941 [Fibularhizoctonia sp. CBS 109695]
MSQSNRKRRAPAAFEWHENNEDSQNLIDQQEPRTTRIRHTTFNSDAAGKPSYNTAYLTAPASPEKRPGLNGRSLDEDMDTLPELQDCPDSDVEDDEGVQADAALDVQYQRHIIQLSDGDAPKRMIRTTDDNPTKKWLDDDRDDFLREMLRLDGRGDQMHILQCPNCEGTAEPIVRCKDCYGGSIVCVKCAVTTHQHLPTHCIERWNVTHFEPTTLKILGLRIQLGHAVGEKCMNPIVTAGDDFVIVDCNGIHQVALDYCGCASAKGLTVQLLRAKLYPATVQAPKTAATFNLLEFFQLLTFESKASAFELYHTLARQTDNTGTLRVPDRYDEFLRMIRQWRNLKMLKRAGRGHDPTGVAGTKEGECAVLCPACPQPGKNLPANWREAPEDTRFIFGLFLAADTNFHMVRMKVSSKAADPTFSAGLSYFCEMSKYREHLAKYGDQKEIHSTCVKHHAVGDANTSRFANLAASGIGTVDCTRHMMKRPNSVGELQKGERYANMDYMFFSSTSQQDFVRLVMSYDIVCQWSVHLWTRMLNMPGYIHIDRENKQIIVLIPKFHLPAHVKSCHTAYSFNLTRGVGQTDGEAPERGWANINPLSSSAKRMGPASYRETIDDHFGDWNWLRIVGLGKSLMQNLSEKAHGGGRRPRDDHLEDFYDFTATIPAASVLQWTSAVEEWEKDNERVNPFVSLTKSVTQHDVRLALAEEDAKELQSEDATPLHEEVTPGTFITLGLELESQHMYRKIKGWTDIQQLYMPEVSVLRARGERAVADSANEIPSYDIALHLPSSLPLRMRTSQKLFEYEFRLRTAQAYEALDEIRGHLRLRTHMYQYKDRNVVGQRANTRSRALLSRVQIKVNASAKKYTCARNALTVLAERTGTAGWDTQLRELSDEDIHAFTDDTEKEREKKGKNLPGKKGKDAQKKALGEGHKMLSVRDDGDDAGVQEALHIEWCRARARSMRWSEEVLLLREEMRRVQAFSQWHADWWTAQARRLPDLSPEDAEGVAAYAAKQAYVRLRIARSFDRLWRTEWPSMPHGAGANDDLLELESASSSFLTNYPASSFL